MRGVELPYDSSRIVVQLQFHRFGEDTTRYAVVTSIERPVRKDSVPPGLFDRIELFRYEPSRRQYVSQFLDVIENGTRVEFRDLTLDGIDEILVSRDSRGETPISSRGLNVYGWTQGQPLHTLFLSDDGNPEILRLDKERIPQIVTWAEYWGVLARQDLIPYAGGIYVFDGQIFTANNPRFAGYYDRQIAAARRSYLMLRKNLRRARSDPAYALYRGVAAWIVWTSASGDIPRARFIWEKERLFLQDYLTDEQYDDLDSFIEDLDLPAQQDEGARRIST